MADKLQNEDFEYSPLAHQHRMSASGHAIYLTALGIVILGILSLPLIYVSISISGQGQIRSLISRVQLSAPLSGRVLKSRIGDNLQVSAGDTLLVFDASAIAEQAGSIERRLRELNKLGSDLQLLCRHGAIFPMPDSDLKLLNPELQLSHLNFKNALREKQINQKHLLDIYLRHSALYEQKVLSLAEFESSQKDTEHAEAEIQVLISTQLSNWKGRALEYREEARLLSQSLITLREQREQSVLTAPYTGSLQNVKPVSPGSFLFANEEIAEISPDTMLLAYVWLNSSDIGLVRPGQLVYLHIDAYNYREWGSLSARVTEISDDTIFNRDGSAGFIVKCRLERNFLTHPTGFQAFVRKGMGLNARFSISSRSLFQLLFDKVDDWANPYIPAKNKFHSYRVR